LIVILAFRHIVVHVPDDGTEPEPAHAPYPVNVQFAQPYAHSINAGLRMLPNQMMPVL